MRSRFPCAPKRTLSQTRRGFVTVYDQPSSLWPVAETRSQSWPTIKHQNQHKIISTLRHRNVIQFLSEVDARKCHDPETLRIIAEHIYRTLEEYRPQELLRVLDGYARASYSDENLLATAVGSLNDLVASKSPHTLCQVLIALQRLNIHHHSVKEMCAPSVTSVLTMSDREYMKHYNLVARLFRDDQSILEAVAFRVLSVATLPPASLFQAFGDIAKYNPKDRTVFGSVEKAVDRCTATVDSSSTMGLLSVIAGCMRCGGEDLERKARGLFEVNVQRNDPREVVNRLASLKLADEKIMNRVFPQLKESVNSSPPPVTCLHQLASLGFGTQFSELLDEMKQSNFLARLTTEEHLKLLHALCLADSQSLVSFNPSSQQKSFKYPLSNFASPSATLEKHSDIISFGMSVMRHAFRSLTLSQRRTFTRVTIYIGHRLSNVGLSDGFLHSMRWRSRPTMLPYVPTFCDPNSIELVEVAGQYHIMKSGSNGLAQYISPEATIIRDVKFASEAPDLETLFNHLTAECDTTLCWS